MPAALSWLYADTPEDMGTLVTNAFGKGWLTSIFRLGAWVGCLYSGFLAEILSRKYAIIANVVIFVVRVVIQCTAVVGGPSCILGGRFVTGILFYNLVS